jgi:hypothetical protein
MSDYGEPLSPKGPGTLVRAKKGAVPLRQEIQDKCDELTRHAAEIETVDGDLDDAMKGLDQSLKELEGRIKREFSEMSTKLEDVMGARCHELTGLAKSHFEKLNAIMAQQREALGEEGHRVKACIEHAIEALELDDAWFIQAYPDIELEPGSSSVGRAKEVLKGGNGSLALSFDERVISDVLVPAIKGHGRLNSSILGEEERPSYASPIGGFNASASPRSPKQSSPVIQSNAGDPFSAGRLNDYVTEARARTSPRSTAARSPRSTNSVLESQVERMLR